MKSNQFEEGYPYLGGGGSPKALPITVEYKNLQKVYLVYNKLERNYPGAC